VFILYITFTEQQIEKRKEKIPYQQIKHQAVSENDFSFDVNNNLGNRRRDILICNNIMRMNGFLIFLPFRIE
jgi:hypothetical protein